MGGPAGERAPTAKPVHYARRRPEQTTLYQLVQEHVETFFAQVGEIEQWLARIGLDQYGPLFREQAIDLTVLPEIGDDDLAGAARSGSANGSVGW